MVVLFNGGFFLNGTWIHPCLFSWDFFPDCSGSAIFSGHFACCSCTDQTPWSYSRNWRISNAGWTFGQQAWHAFAKNTPLPLCVVNGTVLVRGTCPQCCSPALLAHLTHQVPFSVSAHPSPDCPFSFLLTLSVPAFSALTASAGKNPADTTSLSLSKSFWDKPGVLAYPKIWRGVNCFIPQSLCKILTGLSLFWLGIS